MQRCTGFLLLLLFLAGCGDGTLQSEGIDSARPGPSGAVGSLAIRISDANLQGQSTTGILFVVHILDSTGTNDVVPPTLIPDGQQTANISNVPLGPKVVRVEGLDSEGTLLLEGAEPLIVNEGLNSVSVTLFPVGTGVPTALLFSTPPADTPQTDPLSPVSVTILDSNGVPDIDATNPVTLSISSNPGGSTLGGTTTVNAVGGVATFSDLNLDLTGVGYTLNATSPGLTSDTSAPFEITIARGTLLPFTSALTGVFPNLSVFDPSGQFIYIPNIFTPSLSSITVNPDGTLSNVNPDIPLVNDPIGTAIFSQPSGKTLYVTQYVPGNGTVSVFLVDASGGLTPTGPGGVTDEDNPVGLDTHPSNLLLVASSDNAVFTGGRVNLFTISPVDGSLTAVDLDPGPLTGVEAGNPAFPTRPLLEVKMHQNGLAYTNTGRVWMLDTLTPDLVEIAGSPFALDGSGIDFTPSGDFMVVAGPGTVSSYAIHPITGVPTLVDTESAGTTSLSSIFVEAGGEFVYVNGNDELYGFKIDLAGELTPIVTSPFSYIHAGEGRSVVANPLDDNFIYTTVVDTSAPTTNDIDGFSIVR